MSAPFDRCGLASISELESTECRGIFAQLEKEQAAFLQLEPKFRSPEYKWERDALHHWSRRWEYPYALHHLRRWRQEFSGAPPRVIDFGSGVTFFPFVIARLDCRVTCIDSDELCGRDLSRACDCFSSAPGSVEFKLSDGATVPMQNAEADALFCISVLEHAANREALVREFARVLKPDALLLLTVDLSVHGNEALDVPSYCSLTAALERHFEAAFPEKSLHPADVLTLRRGGYPPEKMSGAGLAWYVTKQEVVKPLLGRPPWYPPVRELAVQGLVLRKKRG